MRTWQSEANMSVFLVLLVLFIFVLPSLGLERRHLQLYGAVVSSLMLLFGAAIAWRKRALFIVALVIIAVTLSLKWAALLVTAPAFGLRSEISALVATLTVVYILLSEVFASGPVTSMRIQGAVAVYLLLGLAWSHAYFIVASIVPGSFSLPAHDVSSGIEWFYYSFVSLTTVGFGDILPTHPIARTLTVAEIVTGQLYLAILIGRLVGMQISSRLNTTHNQTIQIAASPSAEEAQGRE